MKAKTTLLAGLAALPLLVAALFWIARDRDPVVQPQSNPAIEKPRAQLRPVTKAETDGAAPLTAPSAARPELPASARRVSYLSREDGDQLGLTARERTAFAHVCAEAASRLMGQIAIFGSLGQVDPHERMMTVNLPPPIASNLEAEFYQQLEANLGHHVVRRLAEESAVQARVTSALLYFGSQPLALSFQAQNGDFNTATRIEWTHVVGGNGNRRASVMLSGSISKDGFHDIYGPVANRILSGN